MAFVLDLFYGIINLLVFFYISQTFDDTASHDLDGAPSYFAFASIGIAITIVLQAASGGLAHRIREEQLTVRGVEAVDARDEHALLAHLVLGHVVVDHAVEQREEALEAGAARRVLRALGRREPF